MTAARALEQGGAGGPKRVDSFLDAKLSRPAPRPQWVRRDALVQAVERAISDHPVTLLAAPAGFGKTTLAAQWLSQTKRPEPAWVALDSGDNDPVRLWTHVATALQRAGCRLDGQVSGLRASGANDLVAELLPSLIDSIAQAPQSIVVMLDDYHFITNPACHEQVGYFLTHLPENARLVLLTRADPPLRLGRMRAAGRLAEIRAEQLSFDADEVAALLSAEDIELSAESIAGLVTLTEGWPAALYLAILSLAGRDDPESLVDRFSGSHRYMAEYLTEEVLSLQPESIRSFIVEVSILERFSAPLCDHVLETGNSRTVLRELERANLFLVPLDGEGTWFRFHHLFAAFARFELETRDRDLARSLHVRAADWFAEHDFADEAIHHSIEAGTPARASRILQANWARYISWGRSATVEAWLRLVGAPDPAADPSALVTAAWMALVQGDETTMNSLLEALESVRFDGPLPDGTTSIESAVAMIKGMGGYGGPLAMMAAGIRAVELETDERSPWFGFANFALGHAHYVAGDLAVALRVLSKPAYSESSLAIIRQFSLAVLSLSARERGQSEQSARYAREAMDVVQSSSLRTAPQASISFTVFGEAQAADGDLPAALASLEEGLSLRRRIPGLSPWPTIYHLLAMAPVVSMAGDARRAELLLDEAGLLIDGFDDGMDAMRARLGAARARVLGRQRTDASAEPLTDREIDVLRLLRGSMTLNEIAAALFLSRNTVKSHVRSLYRKLGVESRSEAVTLARRRGLV